MKIGLCGTMSVGKTTLVKALKKVPEFKNYSFATERSKYLNDLGIPLMKQNIVTDRTVFDVMAFTLNAKSIAHQDKDIFENYAKEFIREYDYIFYISPHGIPVEDNGVRETDEHYRDVIDFSITTLIKKYGHMCNKVEKIFGSTEERIEQILNITKL